MLQRVLQMIKNIVARVSVLSVVLVCFLTLVWGAISSIETTTTAEKQAVLEEAIMRSALHCYSIEGVYPSDVSYLEENYSLNINRDTYIVHYELFASNIAPDITVILRTEGEGVA